jgi:hypothetical protein
MSSTATVLTTPAGANGVGAAVGYTFLGVFGFVLLCLFVYALHKSWFKRGFLKVLDKVGELMWNRFLERRMSPQLHFALVLVGLIKPPAPINPATASV